MSNETTPGAPLTATVGERLEEKAHEGAVGPEQAAAGVGGRPEERREARRGAASPGDARPRARTAPAAGAVGRARSWGLLAGLGTLAAVALVRKMLRR